MGLCYRVDITGTSGVTSITNAATVVWQGTTGSANPIRIYRIELQSNQTGATQTVIPLQFGTYATGTSTGGTTPTPSPVIRRNSVSAVTAWRCLTATLGTTFTILQDWQWNGATPFDYVMGLTPIQFEIQSSVVCALIIPTASGTPGLTGAVYFEEF